MPRQIVTTVYTFQELLDRHKAGNVTTAALDRARNWLQEAQTEHDWYQATLDMWKEALAQIGFLDANISFTGFWSQGDGASFAAEVGIDKLADFLSRDIQPKNCIEGQPEDFRPWLVHKCGKPTDPRYRRLCGLAGYCNPCKVKRTDYHYCHANTCEVDISLDNPGRAPKTEALIGDFERDAESLRERLCRAIYRDLESEYNYLVSDEAISETADANDYTFTIEGQRRE